MVVSGVLFFSLQIFCLYIIVPNFVFMGFLCVGMCVSVYIFISFAFSLTVFSLFVLSFSDLFGFIFYLSWPFFFYSHLLLLFLWLGLGFMVRFWVMVRG